MVPVSFFSVNPLKDGQWLILKGVLLEEQKWRLLKENPFKDVLKGISLESREDTPHTAFTTPPSHPIHPDPARGWHIISLNYFCFVSYRGAGSL